MIQVTSRFPTGSWIKDTCTQFVTQALPTLILLQIGATGGNFGITTCDPSKTQNSRDANSGRFSNLRKTFVRLDTGFVV